MPLLTLQLPAPLPPEREQELIDNLTRTIANKTQKPENYVMVIVQYERIFMAGSPKPAVFGDVRSIGALSGEVNRKLSSEICFLLERFAQIPKERVYLNFSDIAPENWGWNGTVFG